MPFLPAETRSDPHLLLPPPPDRVCLGLHCPPRAAGTLSYRDGGEYVGQWANDRKHGIGKMSFINGDVYNGQWEHGIMHGKGVSLFADGREYRGEYANGKKHGVGTFVFASGRTWTGVFRLGRQYKKHKETPAPETDEELAPPFSTLA